MKKYELAKEWLCAPVHSRVINELKKYPAIRVNRDGVCYDMFGNRILVDCGYAPQSIPLTDAEIELYLVEVKEDLVNEKHSLIISECYDSSLILRRSAGAESKSVVIENANRAIGDILTLLKYRGITIDDLNIEGIQK